MSSPIDGPSNNLNLKNQQVEPYDPPGRKRKTAEVPDDLDQFSKIMEQNFKHGMQLLAMQQQAHRQNEAISMRASIEKSRHDANQNVIAKT
jgi:hypothetical protein